MKYALLTDNSVQWFTFLVSIQDTGEVVGHYQLDTAIKNDYLSNLFARELSFTNLRLAIPGTSVDNFYGIWLSSYDFDRIEQMILLWPNVCEYNRLGKLEQIWIKLNPIILNSKNAPPTGLLERENLNLLKTTPASFRPSRLKKWPMP